MQLLIQPVAQLSRQDFLAIQQLLYRKNIFNYSSLPLLTRCQRLIHRSLISIRQLLRELLRRRPHKKKANYEPPPDRPDQSRTLFLASEGTLQLPTFLSLSISSLQYILHQPHINMSSQPLLQTAPGVLWISQFAHVSLPRDLLSKLLVRSGFMTQLTR